MELPGISKSEWVVMEALWERPAQTASELTKTLRPATKWAENTVRTLLQRLVEKGMLKTGETASATKTFIPAIERETCVRVEGESFLQRVFRGAAKPLLVHFATNARLTPKEVKDLKKLLDQSVVKHPRK